MKVLIVTIRIYPERRAQSLVDTLVSKGISNERISALGKDEANPISDNKDDAGRSLNRRVEVVCASD